MIQQYPTIEELESVGISVGEFLRLYVNADGLLPKWWEFWKRAPTVAEFQKIAMDKFYGDYPQLRKR